MQASKTSFRILVTGLMAGSSLLLAACQTAGTAGQTAGVETSVQASAAQPGFESLSTLENLYKRNPDNADVAVRYARALREDDRLSRASIVISPFAKNERKPNADAKAEFAAIQIALGNNAVAKEYAEKAVALNSTPQAWHILGIALDANGEHAPAEDAFRKALEGWQDNPAPVLNNLGLNLASQGFLDEATEVLRKALVTAPNRGEIERNLRIVEALRESGGRAPSYMQEARDKEKARKAKEEAAKAPQPAAEVEASAIPVPAHKPSAN